LGGVPVLSQQPPEKKTQPKLGENETSMFSQYTLQQCSMTNQKMRKLRDVATQPSTWGCGDLFDG